MVYVCWKHCTFATLYSKKIRLHLQLNILSLNMKAFIVFFTLCTLSSSLLGQTIKPWEPQNIIRIKDQIPEGNTSAIAIDHLGLTYVGGQGHVSVFAQQVRLALIEYPQLTGGVQNALNDKVVLCPDHSGVWVGDKKGLGYIEQMTFNALTFKDTLIKITHIAVIKDTIWILSNSQLYICKRNQKDLSYDKLGNQKFTGLVNINGQIYVSDSTHLYHYSHVKKQLEANGSTPNKIKITDIFDAGNGLIVVSSHNTLYNFNLQPSKFEKLFIVPVKEKITGVKFLDGYTYVGTRNGLFRVKQKQYKQKQYKIDTVQLYSLDNIPLKQVLSLEVSPDSILMIGTRAGGLLMYSPERSKVFVPFHLRIPKPEEIHEYSLRSIVKYESGFIFGTDWGKVFRAEVKNGLVKSGSIPIINLEQIDLQVRSLATDDKNIFVGTGMDIGKIYWFTSNGKLLDTLSIPNVKNIASLRLVDANTLLAGTNNGLFKISFSHRKGFLPPICIDKSEIKNIMNEFVCGTGKLGILVAGESVNWLKIPKDSLSSDDEILHITYDRSLDSHWVSTRGHFIFRVKIKNGKISGRKNYGRENGLIGFDGSPANVIYGSFVDASGALWVSTNYGLYCKPHDSEVFARFTPPVLGLPDNVDANTGAYCFLNDSTLVFGFRHGGVMVNTKAYQLSKTMRMVVIEQISGEKCRILQENDTIEKEENFDVVNLFPYNLDNVFGGAQPVKVNGQLSKEKSTGLAILNQWGEPVSINPNDFHTNLLGAGDGTNQYIFGDKVNISFTYIDNPVWKARFWAGIIIVLIIAIFLLLYFWILYKRKNKIKSAEAEAAKANAVAAKAVAETDTAKAKAEEETAKAKWAEAEAAKANAVAAKAVAETETAKAKADEETAKAKQAEEERLKLEIENNKSHAIKELSVKALGKHFLKNNLTEITLFPNFIDELDKLSIFKSFLKNAGVSKEFEMKISEDIKERILYNPDSNMSLNTFLRKHLAESAEPESVKNILMLYVYFFEMIKGDKKSADDNSLSIQAYYSMLVNGTNECTIMEDAKMINAVCKLYEKNPAYGFKFQEPNIDFSGGDIIINCSDSNFRNAKIPRMLVQPLIENARKHGGEKPFSVKVEYLHERIREKNWVTISVVNNGTLVKSKVDIKDRESEPSLMLIERIVKDCLGGIWGGLAPIKIEEKNYIKIHFKIPVEL